MNSAVVTTANALWLLLCVLWHLTSVSWALIATHLIIKLDFHSVIHHLIISLLLASCCSALQGFFFQVLLAGGRTALFAALLSDVASTTLFLVRMAAVLACQTHRRQNNSPNPWNVAIFPSLSGAVKGSRHKQSTVSSAASVRGAVASFTSTVTAAQEGGQPALTWSQD